MQYQAHQITYWPRLLTVAGSIDAVLAESLRGLMQRGAYLGMNDRGGLQLGPGRLSQEEYDQLKAQHLTPRGEKLRNILRRARDGAHPWLMAVQRAYTDLNERCQRGDKALKAAAAAQDGGRFTVLLVQVTDRHYQAHMVAQSLLFAGYGAYESAIGTHWGAYMDRMEDIQHLHLPYPVTGKAWPVETPDGWIWLADVHYIGGKPFEPAPVNLGGERGQKVKLEDEPVVTDWDLGNALAPIETGESSMWWREAG